MTGRIRARALAELRLLRSISNALFWDGPDLQLAEAAKG